MPTSIGNVSADAENRNLRHGFYISNDETVRLGLDDLRFHGPTRAVNGDLRAAPPGLSLVIGEQTGDCEVLKESRCVAASRVHEHERGQDAAAAQLDQGIR